jgi:DNA-binding CsgD family transcriptional regulator/PAS domain-containing protein
MSEVVRYRDSGPSAWGGPHDVRFLALTTLLPCLVWETDPDGKVLFVSSTCLEVLKRHPSELIGKPFHAVFEDRSWTLHSHVRAHQPSPPFEGLAGPMHQVRAQRGKPLYCRVEGRRCFDPVTGRLSGTIGVAEFGPQEEMRRATAATLCRALAGGLFGVALVDAQGIIRFVNPVFARTVGLAGETALGRRLSEFLRLPAACTPTENGVGVWHEMQTVNRDGDRPRPLASAFSVLCGDPGRQLVIVVDDAARNLAASIQRGSETSSRLLTQYAESLLAGFDDLWPEVVGTLEAAPAQVAGPGTRETTVVVPVETSPSVVEEAPELVPELQKALLANLTSRQAQVLHLLAEGMTNKEIGRTLGISEATVKTHVRSLKDALGAGNRTSTAAIAARLFPNETASGSE